VCAQYCGITTSPTENFEFKLPAIPWQERHLSTRRRRRKKKLKKKSEIKVKRE
jgi:hypothetical protein